MSGKSGVYLVSSSPIDGQPKHDGMDNPGFQGHDTNVAYSKSNGLEMPENRVKPERPYRGMGKEDLLYFSTQPFWRRLRLACIAFVVLAWLALIITVVALVMAYPKCRDPAARSWWQTEVVYRIYVPSFKDSDGDGIGDLKGVESKLSYIQDLGANVISLSPFYETAAAADFKDGNDMAIVDHKAVDANFGSLDDFNKLIKEAHDKDMYVVVDFIPNLTSDQHQWFRESAQSTALYKNFYVWTQTPNNWQSVYDGSAWTADATRGESYLHQFNTNTPDLNLRSTLVQLELESILNFWLDLGVDGFNVRDAAYLYEDYDMRDENLVPGVTTGNTYNDFTHTMTTNQPEVYNIMERWRDLLRANNKTSNEKLLMAGLTGGLEAMEMYGDCDNAGVQMPLNDGAAVLPTTCGGTCVTNYVDGWMNKVPSGKWANWRYGDDSVSRMASRMNTSFIEPFTILTMLLPGTPVLYYGDEIYMEDTPTSNTPWSRQAPMRNLMQWNNETNGGFCNTTSCSLWTPAGDYPIKNVETGSTLTDLIKELKALRGEPSFRVGDYFTAIRDNAIVSFVREFDGETGYLVAINFGPNTESRDFSSSHSTIQDKVIVTMVHNTGYAVDDEIESNDLEIGPYGGVVVSWDYMAKEL